MTTRHIDLGALTPEAQLISETSREIARDIVGDNGPEDRIRQRCVIATGDPQFKDLLRFCNSPIETGLEAISKGAPIYVDINMVRVGITTRGHKCPIHCALDFDRGLSSMRGITRTSAGYIEIDEDLNESIVVIGNAPSAALTVYDLIRGGVRPSLVVATPVGFVNAAESKEAIRELDVHSITCTGTRGGSPVAIAIMNELFAMHYERNQM